MSEGVVKRTPQAGQIDEARRAVVLVDLQNDYVHPDGAFASVGLRLPDVDRLIADVNRLLAAARAVEMPVVWVRMQWDDASQMGLLSGGFLAESGLRTGTWGAELYAGLDVRPGDDHVVKTRFSGFFRTDLESVLQRHRVDGLLVGGVRTDYCVESTVRDAFFRDLPVWVVQECVDGFVPDLHEASLRTMDSIFADVVPLEDAVRRARPLAR